ncbi:MAG: FUSC family protein [Caulobacteraceae bacterium]|nr:FUSC family protein [Caulobacteraceae bacterium]
MALAGVVSYWLMTTVLSRLVDRPSDLLGGMWAAIAAVFVFRETFPGSLRAGKDRLIATGISIAICLSYLSVFQFSIVGLAALLAIGAMTMALLDKRDGIITTEITTLVVMVVAAISPEHAWRQPLLRLVDTLIGGAVGIAFQRIVSTVHDRLRTHTVP